jgi:hypothetical protein
VGGRIGRQARGDGETGAPSGPRRPRRPVIGIVASKFPSEPHGKGPICRAWFSSLAQRQPIVCPAIPQPTHKLLSLIPSGVGRRADYSRLPLPRAAGCFIGKRGSAVRSIARARLVASLERVPAGRTACCHFGEAACCRLLHRQEEQDGSKLPDRKRQQAIRPGGTRSKVATRSRRLLPHPEPQPSEQDLTGF